MNADVLFLPGGMPGATNLMESETVCSALKAQNEAGRLIGAICAAPMVLGKLGILNGKRATCYPGFDQYLDGATYTGEMVTVDGNIITGKGPGAAMAFAYQLLSAFVTEQEVDALKKGMIYE